MVSRRKSAILQGRICDDRGVQTTRNRIIINATGALSRHERYALSLLSEPFESPATVRATCMAIADSKESIVHQVSRYSATNYVNNL